MIVVASSPPVTTFANIPVGQAYRNTGNNTDYIKVSPTQGGGLAAGGLDTPLATAPVTAAPSATFQMWP